MRRFIYFFLLFLYSSVSKAGEIVVISTLNDFARNNKPNVIFDIRKHIDLKQNTLVLPQNCVLRFSGGVLNNGKLIGNNTVIDNPSNQPVFDHIDIGEEPFQFINDFIYVDWFFGKGDADKTQSAFDFAKKNRTGISFLSREYVFDHTVMIEMGQILMRGSGAGGEYRQLGTVISSSAVFRSDFAGDPLFFVSGEPRDEKRTLGLVSGRITGLSFTTARKQDVFQFYLSGAPSRPLFIDHCRFYSCNTALRILENQTSTELGFLYVENCTMTGNRWNIVAHGRHSLLGLYFCRNVAEQCDGNINLGYSEVYTSSPYEDYAPRPVDYAASANIVITDNLLEGTVDCIYINGGKCIVNIERNYFETSRKQFVVLSFSTSNSVVSFNNNYI